MNNGKRNSPPPRFATGGPTVEVVELRGRRVWPDGVQTVDLIPYESDAPLGREATPGSEARDTAEAPEASEIEPEV